MQTKFPMPNAPRTSLWLKPKDLYLPVLVDLFSVFDSAGNTLLFETVSTLIPLLPLWLFLPSLFCCLSIIHSSWTFCQPTCTLIKSSPSPSLSRRVVKSGARSWVSTCVGFKSRLYPPLTDREKVLIWVSLSVKGDLPRGLLWDFMKYHL